MNQEKLARLKSYVESLQSSINDINEEIAVAEKKEVFAYPRSKNIRKSALLINKNAKNIRDVSLALFKDGEAAAE